MQSYCLSFLDSITKKLFLRFLHFKTQILSHDNLGYTHLNGYSVKYTDIFSLYVEYKDLFIRRIYHINSRKLTPNVIDGGGCIGMSVLYFQYIRNPELYVLNLMKTSLKYCNKTSLKMV